MKTKRTTSKNASLRVDVGVTLGDLADLIGGAFPRSGKTVAVAFAKDIEWIDCMGLPRDRDTVLLTVTWVAESEPEVEVEET